VITAIAAMVSTALAKFGDIDIAVLPCIEMTLR
jgi:hypothetical protein